MKGDKWGASSKLKLGRETPEPLKGLARKDERYSETYVCNESCSIKYELEKYLAFYHIILSA